MARKTSTETVEVEVIESDPVETEQTLKPYLVTFPKTGETLTIMATDDADFERRKAALISSQS